jgi:peptide/nickel transport system substrate-binding protein
MRGEETWQAGRGRRLTRRGLVRGALGITGVLLVSACTPTPPPAPAATPKPAEAPTPAPPKPAVATTEPPKPAGAQPTAVQAATAAPKPTTAAAETPRPGGSMVLALQAHGGSLDPGTNSDGNAFGAIVHLHDPLVRVKPVSPAELNAGTPLGDIAPGLAESWKVADDGVTWTFNLRKGVLFQDGTPFTADAVITAIDRNLNESNPYYFKGKMINAVATYGTIASYRAVDPSTVEIKLKQRYAPFLKTIASAVASVASPAALAKYGEDLANNPVGTGAFKFVEYRQGDVLTLDRSPDWWGGKTSLDRISYRVAPESAVRIAMLEKGEVDFAEAISPDLVDQIKNHPKLELLQVPGGSNHVFMANQRKPFDDIRVRMAMNLAVNKDEINEQLYRGMGIVANAPMAPMFADYDSTLKPFPYDPQKAKELLAAAGYQNGFETNLMAYNATQLFNPVGGVKFAEAIQLYLSKVGVKVNIDAVELAAWSQRRLSGNFDMALGGWFGTSFDSDGWFYQAYHSSQIPGRNSAQVKDDKLDKMIVDGQQEYDPAKRTAIYRDIQKYIWEQVPWIYVNFPASLSAVNRRVRDFRLYYIYAPSLHTTWLAQ